MAHRKPTPSYLLHSASGRARAVWTDAAGNRRDKLLPGPFDSPESRAAFGALILEVESSPAVNASGLSLAELLAAYHDHAERHYRGPDAKPTSEIYEVKVVIKALRLLYARVPATEFGPLKVKAARQLWVNEGRSRSECNRCVGVIKRLF